MVINKLLPFNRIEVEKYYMNLKTLVTRRYFYNLFHVCGFPSDFTLRDGKHERNSRVVVTILNACIQCHNAATLWWPTSKMMYTGLHSLLSVSPRQYGKATLLNLNTKLFRFILLSYYPSNEMSLAIIDMATIFSCQSLKYNVKTFRFINNFINKMLFLCDRLYST